MIQLNCTNKLLTKVSISDCEASANPLSSWYAHLVVIQKRNCLFMVHEATRFPLIMIGLTKPDFKNLSELFQGAFINTLLKIGAEEKHFPIAEKLFAPLCFQKGNNRSLQGSINQMKANAEHLLWHDDLNIMDCSAERMSAWLAEMPTKPKGFEDYIWPDREMLKLLDREGSEE